mgnify:CR=1 FL=1
MITHPFFDGLLAHSDDELVTLIGGGITERTTIHEWPLSWVQRLILEDGTRLLYKSQLPPTVEPEFYARASSPLLPACRMLGTLRGCTTIVIEWIDAPLLGDVDSSETELVEHGRRLVEQIGQIEGDLPVYLDIGSPDRWQVVAEGTLRDLDRLVAAGRFSRVDTEAVNALRAWAESSVVLATVSDEPRVVHGDLDGEQVFVTPIGYRVVDWQRPVVAPADVDLVALLTGQGIDARPYVDRATIGIFWFLRLHGQWRHNAGSFRTSGDQYSISGLPRPQTTSLDGYEGSPTIIRNCLASHMKNS